MKNKLGYLEEAGYAAEGGVIRHGEVLRDILVDGDEQNRVLGMIGLADLEFTQIDIVNGSAPMAYMIVMFGENIQMVPLYYTDPMVFVYGFDPELTGVRQIFCVEMFGYQALSVVTLSRSST